MSRPTIEVCVETVDGALCAAAVAADRLELASALGVGGVTPSPGLLAEVRERVELPIVVLARPRRGDFLYSEGDFATLRRDVTWAKESGAAGVAVGVLSADGSIDRARTEELVRLARPLAVTFHRAFDHTRDLAASLEVLVELGIERVLTSGGAPDVDAGRERIAELVELAKGRISVMPGGGVSPGNAVELVRATGVRELHLSAGVGRPSAMTWTNPGCELGASEPISETTLVETDAQRLRALVRAFDRA